VPFLFSLVDITWKRNAKVRLFWETTKFFPQKISRLRKIAPADGLCYVKNWDFMVNSIIATSFSLSLAIPSAFVIKKMGNFSNLIIKQTFPHFFHYDWHIHATAALQVNIQLFEQTKGASLACALCPIN
jgi:hypothetical protein